MDTNSFTLIVRNQEVTFTVSPANSVWDAAQVTDVKDKNGNVMGCGDFGVNEYRIFATDMRTAKRVAGVLDAYDFEADRWR